MYKTWRIFALGGALITFVSVTVVWFRVRDANALDVTVYKTPSCGCCTEWVGHLRDNGFHVTALNVTDLTQIKRRYGVTPDLAACHTAIVDGYVVEGHVPADVIRRFLEERPPVAGLAVPGMPMGSPGMEGSYREPYNVLTFDRHGKLQIYARR